MFIKICNFVLLNGNVMKKIILYFIIAWCLSGALMAQTASFPLPEVPQMLATPADRANYLAAHYWDRFDFQDNTLIDKPEITEQGFANFISIMPYVTEKQQAFSVFAQRMAANPKMLAHLLEVSERYLFDNFSPVYEEELYLLLVEELLEQPRLSLVQRERLRFQQKLCLKNRVDRIATDFGFVLRNGRRMALKEVQADYILLFLNDPECSACQQIKESLGRSEIVDRWENSGRMKVLSVCIEGETEGWKKWKAPEGWIDGCDKQRVLLEEDLYDLRNLPAIYLLDADKRILLKNATVQKLEQVLKQLK